MKKKYLLLILYFICSVLLIGQNRYIYNYTIDSKLTQVPIRKDDSKDNIKDTNTAEATSEGNDRHVITLTDEKGRAAVLVYEPSFPNKD